MPPVLVAHGTEAIPVLNYANHEGRAAIFKSHRQPVWNLMDEHDNYFGPATIYSRQELF